MGSLTTHEYVTFDDVLIKPAASAIEPREAKLETAIARGFLLSIPILSASMDTVTETAMAVALSELGGLGVIHRNNTAQEQAAMVRAAKGKGARVGAACGPFDVERAKLLVSAGADIISIDSAHGHNTNVIAGAKRIKKILGRIPLIVGNIATKGAARALCAFADGIKVGIGPGSICTTRLVSGVGVPQLSAIMDVAAVAKRHGVPVIADGGMRTSGDIAKALAAGASAVMLGNLLAGTDAAPGKRVRKDGRVYKEYRGMGSRAVLDAGMANDRYLAKSAHAVPEGVSGLVPYKGPLDAVVRGLTGGVQVSMGYVGARNIGEFQKKAEFIRVSPVSLAENSAHSLSFVTG